MNRTELVIATAAVLFAAVLLGWILRSIIQRFSRVPPDSLRELERMALTLQRTEAERDKAIADLAARDGELNGAYDGLRESRAEIEELRDYIDRRIKPPQG